MIKILIAEDQTLFRDSLEWLINSQDDMQVIGVTSNADEVHGLCQKVRPNLILMDVVTNNMVNGIIAAAKIRQDFPDIKIVIMTALPEITFIDAAKKAGAHSFIYKSADRQHLLYVIHRTVKNQGIYPGPEDSYLFKVQFSNTEIAIIRLVCQGKNRKEIAQTLAMSEGSVKAVVTAILNKTGFDSIMKFAVYAVANGFIIPNHNK